VEHQPLARLRLDQLAELVTVPGSGFQHGEEEQFRHPFFSSRSSAERSISVIGRYSPSDDEKIPLVGFDSGRCSDGRRS
jgi:hypothetical protein